MTLRQIIIFPDPALREQAQLVSSFDDDLLVLTNDLLETMYAFKGVGLAAPQIGELLRIFVMDADQEDQGNPLIFINPSIVEFSAQKEMVSEGCLSFPDVYEDVSRHTWVVVEAVDVEGQPFSLRLEGLASQCAQHEIEHLDGHVLVDNVGRAKRRFITKNLRKRKKTKRLRYAV